MQIIALRHPAHSKGHHFAPSQPSCGQNCEVMPYCKSTACVDCSATHMVVLVASGPEKYDAFTTLTLNEIVMCFFCLWFFLLVP